MLAEVISKKGAYWRCRKVGSTEEYYVATDGEQYAHGKTIRDARADLDFKTRDRDPSQYKNLLLSHSMKIEEAVVCYRRITGACSFGVRSFLENLPTVKDAYTISEIIELTSNAYGGNQFRSFFSSNLSIVKKIIHE